MQWSPPLNAATKAKVDAMQARERARLAAVARGENPADAFTACTFGYPGIMLDTPLMFEVLVTPKETALIFSSREIRHIYTDGRPHTPKDDLWATPWGDSIGHWEGQTLVMDTIAVKGAYGGPDSGSAVSAFGDVEGFLTIGVLTQQAHFIERMRMIDPGHLEDQMTIIDPANLTAPWHMTADLRTSGEDSPHGLRRLRGRGSQSHRQWKIHASAAAIGEGPASSALNSTGTGAVASADESSTVRT